MRARPNVLDASREPRAATIADHFLFPSIETRTVAHLRLAASNEECSIRMPTSSLWIRVTTQKLIFLFCLYIVSESRFFWLILPTTSSQDNSVRNHENGTSDLPHWRNDSNSKINKTVAGNLRTAKGKPLSGDEDGGPPVFGNNFTIVIQLSGEMANHLYKFAAGYVVKWILEDDFNITSRIVLRHQDNQKWVRGRKSMMCFTKLRHMDYSQGNTQEFEDRWKQQQAWIGGDGFEIKTAESLRQTVKDIVLVFANASTPPPVLPVDANITIPFIYANYFQGQRMIDKYFDRLRDLFEFDLTNPDCCGESQALRNESLFHARGFAYEMPKQAKTKGFEELSPNKTVTELLQNHQRGDKIAVLSRFPSYGQLYVDRMLSKGLDARLVETTNGEQSFCFLMSGQTEIIGSTRSTFVAWASFLGNASKARIYDLHSPYRAACILWCTRNFTNPELRRKFSIEDYNSEEQEEIERGH
ncbi:hypothetical protein MHU86_8794 [Fragilaria crotonensis]|nr:hypothetical protein MHU86_8794 [Fragilaria crotonensis]